MKKTRPFLLTALPGVACLAPCARAGEGTMRREVCISSESGLTLRGYLLGPAAALGGKQKCPLVILMHGLMDSGEFTLIRRQADAYAQAGYAVLAVDFDGHGRSDGSLLNMTISKELADAGAILAYAQGLPFASRVILTGHSQGGVVASILAARHPDAIDDLILLAPAGMLSDRFRAGTCFGTRFAPADPPERVMVFDDYVGRTYIEDAMQLDLYALAAGYHGHPVLLLAGGEDPLVSREAVQRYKALYSRPEAGNTVTLRVIDGAPHDFAGHEDEVIMAVLTHLSEGR